MIASELLTQYDVLFVDLYGVIWDGAAAYSDALSALKSFVLSGKNVTILSNTSLLSSDILEKYDANDLKPGVHFSDFVTSGDTLRTALVNGSLMFNSIKSPKKYFVYGPPNEPLFRGAVYEHSANVDDADFIYMSATKLKDVENMPPDMKKSLYLARACGTEYKWQSTSIDPFVPDLMSFFKKKKPLVIANPDKYAMCSVIKTPTSSDYITVKTVQQGLLGGFYEKIGGEVLFTGKPHDKIYKHAIDSVAKKIGGSIDDVCRLKIAMIGDTLGTDILGAQNASKSLGCQIDSILVMTGITARDIRGNGEIDHSAIKDFCEKEKILPTHVISKLGLDADVIW